MHVFVWFTLYTDLSVASLLRLDLNRKVYIAVDSVHFQAKLLRFLQQRSPTFHFSDCGVSESFDHSNETSL